MAETRHRLTRLLEPRSIAVVGASARPGAPGNVLLAEIRRGGFEGALYAVNPNRDAVDGLACHPSIGDLPEAVDLAVLAVANHRLEAQLAAAIEAGAGAAVIFASGVLEDDGDPPLLERLRRRARVAGIQVCGGNGMGFYNFEAGAWVCPYAVESDSGPGVVTLVTHSGSAFTSLLDLGARLRFNLAVSPGQEITTTTADYLDYALDQPSTRVVALFLEAVRDPTGFVAALDKAKARDVPVVALKVGRSAASAAFALGHSGAIVGSDDAFQALCDRHGVIRVADLDELIATASLFALPRRVGPGGLAAIMASGGERELLVDVADDLAVPFADIGEATTAVLESRLDYGLDPVNPCDAWGTVGNFEEVFTDCFEALIDDPDAAIGVLLADIREGRFINDRYVAICRAMAKRHAKPLAIATWASRPRYGAMAEALIEDGVLVLDGLVPTLKAVSNAFAYRDFRSRPAIDPPAPPAAGVRDRWRARLARGGALDEAEGLALLADFGIPALAAHIAEGRDEALRAARSVGYPVALKTAAPGVHHKSDVGGVALDLADDGAVAAAYDDVAGRLGPRVVVAPMAGAGVELALGVTIDPQFGPLVMVGTGGVLVEVLRDTRTALPPIDAESAKRLIDQLRVRPLLDGVRGGPAAEIDAIAGAVSRLSVLAAVLGDCIAEIDVNPLIAGPHGCVAVDALVVGRPARYGHGDTNGTGEGRG